MKLRHILGAGMAATLWLLGPGAMAQDKPKVVLATWGGSNLQSFKDTYVAPFTAATGYEVELNEVPNPSAAIISANGNPEFNVAIGTYFDAAQLSAKGLLVDFARDELEVLADYTDDLLPRTADGSRVTAMPMYHLFYGIAYNKELAAPGDFDSWQALVDPKWARQTTVTRPVYLSTYDIVMAAYLNGGDESNIEPGLPWMKALLGNVMSVYSSMGNFVSLLAQGEVVAGPFYSSLKKSAMDNADSPFDLVLPKEGALMLPYAMIMVANAKDNPAVLAWMNYVGSAELQTRASEALTLPTNPKASFSPKLKEAYGMEPAELMAKLHKPDWNVVAAKQEERARLIEKMISDLGVK